MTDANPVRPALTVVVVTYNSAGIVASALSSLVGRSDVEVIVVDNASTDDTVECVRRIHPEIVIVQSAANGGFASGVNQGIARAQGEVVLLLNPDAVIEWPDVQRCLRVLEDDVTTGVVAPRTVQPDGRQAILDAGRAPTVWRCFTHATGLSRASGWWRGFEGLYLFPAHVTGRRSVDWVSGCCMFVRHSVLKEVGGLTERWFMYAEDIELCLRIKDAGHKVVLEPHAQVLHQIGSSSTPESGASATNSAWLLNLYDLYRMRREPGALRALAWKSVAVFWMLSRAAVFRWRGSRVKREETDWRSEGDKFAKYGRDIWRADASS